MQKIRALIGLTILVVVGCLAWAGLAAAQSFHSGTNVDLGKGQTIRQTVFAAGQTVNINSDIFGDVFCAGQTVTITGTVHGDVVCAGQTVRVSGRVDGDVRLAGQSVSLSATVRDNATIGGQTFVLESDGSIGNDLSVGSTKVTIRGNVGRDVALASNTASINSTVGRDLQANVQSLTLDGSARVTGNVTYTSPKTLNKMSGAVVDGKTTHNQPSQAISGHHNWWKSWFVWFLYSLIALLFMIIILTLIFPRLFHVITDTGLPRPWKALLVGLVAHIVMPFIIVALFATVIGVPLALLTLLVWLAIGMLLSVPVFGYYIGRLLLRRPDRPLLSALVGIIVLVILLFIPFLDVLVWIISVLMGTGMILLAISRHNHRHGEDEVAARSGHKPIREGEVM